MVVKLKRSNWENVVCTCRFAESGKVPLPDLGSRLSSLWGRMLPGKSHTRLRKLSPGGYHDHSLGQFVSRRLVTSAGRHNREGGPRSVHTRGAPTRGCHCP